MAIGANSYGTVAGVSGYTPLYVDASTKLYTASTVPTISRVESWINEVSAIANAALSSFRFTVPVTQADCVLMLTGQVEQCVADLCNLSRSSGRFVSERIAPGVSAMGMLRREMYDWVEANALGMENLGAARSTSNPGEDTMSVGVLGLNFAAHGDDPEITT